MKEVTADLFFLLIAWWAALMLIEVQTRDEGMWWKANRYCSYAILEFID